MSAPQLIMGGQVISLDREGVAVTDGIRLGLRGVLIDEIFFPTSGGELQVESDEITIETIVGGLRVQQRHGVDEVWTWRLRLINDGDRELLVQPVVEITATTGWQRRAWLAGAQALVVSLPMRPDQPVWVARPRLGTLALGQPTGNGTYGDLPGSREVVMAAQRLAPGEQTSVQWRTELVADPAAAAALLPSWLPDRLELEPGMELELDLPDAAIVVDGPDPGVQQWLVHAGSGTTALTVSLPYRLDDLVDAVADQAESRGVRRDDGAVAEALILLHASTRGSHPEAEALAEEVMLRLPVDDGLAVIAAATGVSSAGWFDGVVPDDLMASAARLPGLEGELARLYVHGSALVGGATPPPAAAPATSAARVLSRLGAGLPGESDALSPQEVGLLLAWAAAQPESAWSLPAGTRSQWWAAAPGMILERALSWALARLGPDQPSAQGQLFSPSQLRAIAWLTIHQQLVRG